MAANTIIFGGSGKVARHLTRLLANEGHNVYSVIRKPEQQEDVKSLGGKPVLQSIEEASVDDMVKTIQDTKASTVVWAAGAGAGNADRTKAVDQEGAIRSMDATSKAGVKRYIIVSGVDVRDRENKPEPEWYHDGDRERSNKTWDAIGPYMHAKFAADRSLVTENDRRGLEYTIVRPGGLSQDPGTGKVAAGKPHITVMVPREDVASVVVECIKNESTKGLVFDLVGGETPIKDAIADVVKEKTNTFEGRY
ncbi:unnamed protein product [Zymoseptoria tritici ST99CH_3D1]|nr:unnamed protein product [Zymoseptoria tritici ST99CH_3D1]